MRASLVYSESRNKACLDLSSVTKNVFGTSHSRAFKETVEVYSLFLYKL